VQPENVELGKILPVQLARLTKNNADEEKISEIGMITSLMACKIANWMGDMDPIGKESRQLFQDEIGCRDGDLELLRKVHNWTVLFNIGVFLLNKGMILLCKRKRQPHKSLSWTVFLLILRIAILIIPVWWIK